MWKSLPAQTHTVPLSVSRTLAYCTYCQRRSATNQTTNLNEYPRNATMSGLWGYISVTAVQRKMGKVIASTPSSDCFYSSFFIMLLSLGGVSVTLPVIAVIMW